MADAWVTLPAMCRGVWQASHIMQPLSTQQWWVPGGTKNGELWMAIAAENALNSSETRWDRIRELQYQGYKLWSLLNSMGYQTINIHIYIFTFIFQWRALRTKITEVNWYAFMHKLFHEDFSSILRTNPNHMNVTWQRHKGKGCTILSINDGLKFEVSLTNKLQLRSKFRL